MGSDGRVVHVVDTSGDVGAVLLAHARWADLDVLGACAGLTDAQLDRRFEMGPGSLRATVTEIIAAMRAWGDLYAGRAERGWMADEGPFAVARLRELAIEQHDDWAEIVGRFALDGVIERPRGGRTWRYTRAQIVAHVFTHSMHHRAQAINMLRHITGLPAASGKDGAALPSGSVVSWVRSVS
jgi:uncharacterized damage-inducible protein DinB